MISDPKALTPVEKHNKIWLKRDDLYKIAGVRGGKARTCYLLANRAKKGLVTASSRHSPQVAIVARLAKMINLPCRIHTPRGKATPEINDALSNGAMRIPHKIGFNNVIIARARQDSQKLGWTEIPFGMECKEAVESSAIQVDNIPNEVSRIIVPVGSGMTLAGILTGLERNKRDIPILGIIVGADPIKRLDFWAPIGWRDKVKFSQSNLDYHIKATNAKIFNIQLDPIYEAKCIPFIKAGDCLWIVGIRSSAL